LDVEHLTKRLREVAVEQLEQAPEEELWLIADCSDLRKPYAEVMPYLSAPCVTWMARLGARVPHPEC